MYFSNILDLIGNTPLLSLEATTGIELYAKAEFLNPGGSIKDRIALNMLEEAEKSGKLRPGMTIIEPTSGNTGIGLALCGVRKGYRVIIVMPENMSEERKKIIHALGAELVLTPPWSNWERKSIFLYPASAAAARCRELQAICLSRIRTVRL